MVILIAGHASVPNGFTGSRGRAVFQEVHYGKVEYLQAVCR
jgi:hypothetical protein